MIETQDRETTRSEFRAFVISDLQIVWLLVCFGFCASNFGFGFSGFVSDFDIRISNLLG